MRDFAAAERAAENLEDDIAEALKGNRDAFDRVIQGIEARVMRTAIFLLRNTADAEDVAQEVYVRVFRNLRQCRAAENFERWVYRITVNSCRDFQRRRRLWFPLTVVREFVRPADPVLGERFAKRLVKSLNRLRFKERAAFVLIELEELETAEVAEILQCSQVTVRGYLHDARTKLRRDFADLKEEP